MENLEKEIFLQTSELVIEMAKDMLIKACNKKQKKCNDPTLSKQDIRLVLDVFKTELPDFINNEIKY